MSTGLATVVVFPSSELQAAETDELVTRLRREVLPPVARATGATFLVGGSTAAAEDFAAAVAGRLPLFVWWLPAGLARRLPRVALEHERPAGIERG